MDIYASHKTITLRPRYRRRRSDVGPPRTWTIEESKRDVSGADSAHQPGVVPSQQRFHQHHHLEGKMIADPFLSLSEARKRPNRRKGSINRGGGKWVSGSVDPDSNLECRERCGPQEPRSSDSWASESMSCHSGVTEYSGAGHQKPSHSSCVDMSIGMCGLWSCGPHTSSTRPQAS